MAIRQQLQASLGSAYTLDRELGGGGMSRVFVADEHALGRRVVVKVLRPDLAEGLSVDRFRREILLAAGLQQANIVPVLSAGVSEGLPYYTMPFVDGESLRARINRDGPLPVSEAVRIVEDVAKALAHAHARGVVHRDIKPDNVLLSGGTAVVTDFGIAKAITAARDGVGEGNLTSIGTSIGTPAYMAPEQAAGDPDVDHRADLYALGVLAYELIAGRPPFADVAPHRLLAAHMTTAPTPLQTVRPDIPPTLAALVMRLLEKEPDARPQSATDVVHALASLVATPSGGGHDALPAIALATRRTLGRALGFYAAAFVVVALLTRLAIDALGLPDWVFPATLVVMALGLPAVLFTAFVHHGARVARTTRNNSTTMTRIAVQASPHVTWRRTTWAMTVALGVLAVLVAGYMTLRAFGIGPAGSLFAKGLLSDRERILVADFRAPAADSSLGAVVTEAVRTNLAQSRAISIVPASFVSAALERMQRPATSRVDLALARELAQREGVKAVLDGQVATAGAGFLISARLVAAESGDELASVQEAAKDATDLIPAIDRATRRLRGRMGESLRAVRASPPLVRVTTASLPALRKYAEAYRARYVDSDTRRALALALEATRLDSTFASAYRLAAAASLGITPRAVSDSLFTTAYRLRDRLPASEAAFVESAYYSRVTFDNVRSLEAAQRSVELDPTSGVAWNALAVRQLDMGHFAAAESAYARAVALGDVDGIAMSAWVSSAINAGHLDVARRSIDRLRAAKQDVAAVRRQGTIYWITNQLDSAIDVMARAPSNVRRDGAFAADYAHVLRARGRLREARAATPSLLADAIDATWFLTQTGTGAAKLDSLVAREPARAADPSVGIWYAAAGRADRAHAVLARLESDADSINRRRTRESRAQLAAWIAIAEHRYADVPRELARVDTTNGEGWISDPLFGLAERGIALDLGGQRDSAIAVMERFFEPRMSWRPTYDQYFAAGFHKRLGELYEARGDRARAASHYAAFVDLWKNADPELQPKVREVRARLARISTEGKP